MGSISNLLGAKPLNTYAVKTPPLHISPNNFVAKQQSLKNMRGVFRTKWPKTSKYVHIQKVTSSGRAEITSINFDHLNLSSAIWHSPWKSKHTFDILGHLVKKTAPRFLKDGLAREILWEMCKGVGPVFTCFSSISIYLKVNSHCLWCFFWTYMIMYPRKACDFTYRLGS